MCIYLSLAECSAGQIQLVGGASLTEGRVEVCNNNIWGTVCDDFFAVNEANVICRQLGYLPPGTRAAAEPRARFGQGTGPITFDDLACTGTEASLFDCPHRGLNIHNCLHSEDAGVTCPAGAKRTLTVI